MPPVGGTKHPNAKGARIAVESRISRRHYPALFSTPVEESAEQIRPQLAFISAGFDANHANPVGSLGLDTGDFLLLTSAVLDVACQLNRANNGRQSR